MNEKLIYVTQDEFLSLVPLARSRETDRDHESCFLVRAAGGYGFIRHNHVNKRLS